MSLPSTTRRNFLRASSLAASAVALRGPNLLAQATQADARIDILPAEPIATISPEIYSHFIEHLGGVIYDGVWVGEGSKVPNENGIRKAFIDAMRAVKAPVLRWPGGWFRRQLRLARRHRPRGKTSRPDRLLEPAGLQPVRPARVHCGPATPSAASHISPRTCARYPHATSTRR